MSKTISLSVWLLAALMAASSSMRAAGSSGSGAIVVLDPTPIVQDFNSLSATTTPSNVLPNGWYLVELNSGAAADGLYVVGTGSGNAGGAYSFGAAGSTERALGSLGSGTVTPIHYGAQLTNLGSGPITALAISFDGEMWRRGSPTAPDSLTFAYSSDASNLTTGNFTPLPALSFESPGAACQVAAGAVDGNTQICRAVVTATVSGLAVNPGASIWIRWTDVDTGGSDDGLSIDNVTIAATFSSDPTPPNTTSAASPNPASPGQTVTLAGTILPGFNPRSLSFSVRCNLTSLGGSSDQILPNDGATFSFSLELSPQTTLGANSLPCSIEDDQHRSTPFNIVLKVLLPLSESCNATATPINAIQGPLTVSPLNGDVVDVEAIVAGDFQGPEALSGFYVEEPAGTRDSNPATSEGLFIFNSTPVEAGNRVRIRGTVSEFMSSTGPATSRLTELSNVSSVQVCGVNEPLSPPIELTLPIDDASHWERYEGMLVRFSQQLVVVGNVNLGRFGQIELAPSLLYQPTQTLGNAVSWAAAANLIARSRIALDDGSTQSNANLNGGTVAPYPPPGLSDANTLRVGALVNPGGAAPIPLVGIVDDRFGEYRIHPTSAVTFSTAPNPRRNTAAIAAAAGARFRITNANVLNFFTTLGSRGAATDVELNNQRVKLVAQLSRSGGDVIGISEIQNFANGQTNGGTYTNAALADLTAALAVGTGRNYRYVDTIDVANLAPGNVIEDNGTDAIRNAIIYDAGKVTPVGLAALYYQNDQNRPTLAQTFKPAAGLLTDLQTFTVVVNHFRSKGSPCGPGNDDPFQGNCNGMRTSMAGNVATWLAANPTADPAGANRQVILIGDFNAYFGEDPIQLFLGTTGYTNLIDLLLGPKAYSFNFASQLGYLDHALVNQAALRRVKAIAELHINADEPPALQALDANLKSPTAQTAYFAPNEFAASDHDPIVVGFNPLQGDFDDDGRLDLQDGAALLLARLRSREPIRDRRMDMNGDGLITLVDFQIWETHFINWKKATKSSN